VIALKKERAAKSIPMTEAEDAAQGTGTFGTF
jgi:hypothetical protein